MIDQQFYRYSEAAEIIGVSIPSLNHFIRTGQLPIVGARRNVLITAAALRHFMACRDGMPDGTPHTGYVYLFRFREYHKIGFSIDARRRLQDLDSSYPEPVTAIHVIPTNDMQRGEALLHSRYANCRVRGEWFRLNGREVNAIRRIKALLFG